MNEVTWERRGMIHHPITETPKAGRKPQPTVGEWTPARLREAHRRFGAGEVSFLVAEGERLYQRERKRAQRAGRMSPTDRAWAEREAVRGSWVLDTIQNRAKVTNTTE